MSSTPPTTLDCNLDVTGVSAPSPCSASFRGVSVIKSDCMKVMAELADNAYDLAICDPPYGMNGGMNDNRRTVRKSSKNTLRNFGRITWDKKPSDEYFQELMRVSRHQIIWGGNNFKLPPTRGFIFWDKVNDLPTMSDGEMAWTNFDKPARKIRIRKAGSEKNPIHPNQKPVQLYEWLLANYAKPGWRILDTHMGSGSSVIAALELGFEMLAIEIDEHYYVAAVERIGRYELQGTFAMTRNEKVS